MKKLLFLFLSFISTLSFAQKVDLDRAYFNAEHIQLPSDPILEDSRRTYSTTDDIIAIAGYSKVNTNASLQIEFTNNETRIENFEIREHKREKKDKDGHIISTKYTYSINLNYKAYGEIRVYNLITGENEKKKFRKSSSYSKSSFKSRSKAQYYYDNNRYSLRNKYSKEQRQDIIDDANTFLNNKYGYPIINAKTNLWILGNKSNPEFSMHQKAFNDTKAIFAKMTYNKSTIHIAKELEPTIQYFIKAVAQFSGKKKRMRKMRYASYYNLARIYYLLDNVSKTKEYGRKIIDNDYDKKDGKYFIKIANRLQERLTVNQVSSRHFNVLTEDLTQQDFSNQQHESTSSEPVLAYLITAKNDTIKATIRPVNIANINYGVDLDLPDNTGNSQVKYFDAENCNALALTNGDLYKVLSFKEAKTVQNDSNYKFAKVLFESDKIELYLFDDKELILKRPNEKTGKSTLSSDFVFGFNKKLATYSDCLKVLEKTKRRAYKNNAESLIEFCEELSQCE